MSAISLFEEKQVRRAWNACEEKWDFSIDDVVLVLTDSANVKDYIKKLRKRDSDLYSNRGTICPPVEMTAADGKHHMTDLELIFTMLGEASTRDCVPPAAVPMNSKFQTKMNTSRQSSVSATPSLRYDVPFQCIQFPCHPQTSDISLLPPR